MSVYIFWNVSIKLQVHTYISPDSFHAMYNTCGLIFPISLFPVDVHISRSVELHCVQRRLLQVSLQRLNWNLLSLLRNFPLACGAVCFLSALCLYLPACALKSDRCAIPISKLRSFRNRPQLNLDDFQNARRNQFSTVGFRLPSHELWKWIDKLYL